MQKSRDWYSSEREPQPRYRDPSVPTIGALLAGVVKWMWANCERIGCDHGQRAMAVAMIYPEAKRGRYAGKDEGSKSAEAGGFSASRLKQARAVLRNSQDSA